MTAIAMPQVGRIWIPTPIRFLPGQTTGRGPGYRALVSVAVFHGDEGEPRKRTLVDWGFAQPTVDGLRDKWRAVEALQREYGSPEAMIAAIGDRLRRTAYLVGHNERVNNGGAVAGTLLFGLSSGTTGTTNATVNVPTRIALCNLSSLSVSATHQSLGTNTANVTTNEFTSAGLSRTGALTPNTWSAQSGLDTTAGLHIANTFTCSSGPQTVYGTALVDNTTTAFNMFAEYLFASSAILATNDQVADTWAPLF